MSDPAGGGEGVEQSTLPVGEFGEDAREIHGGDGAAVAVDQCPGQVGGAGEEALEVTGDRDGEGGRFITDTVAGAGVVDVQAGAVGQTAVRQGPQHLRDLRGGGATGSRRPRLVEERGQGIGEGGGVHRMMGGTGTGQSVEDGQGPGVELTQCGDIGGEGPAVEGAHTPQQVHEGGVVMGGEPVTVGRERCVVGHGPDNFTRTSHGGGRGTLFGRQVLPCRSGME